MVDFVQATNSAPLVNPYRAGNPILKDEDFFGRGETVDWIVQELSNPGTNSLVVSGQRRIGKTSLLHKLQRCLPPDSCFPVYFDLLDQAESCLANVLLELADAITQRMNRVVAQEARMPYPEEEDFDNRGRFFLNEFLPEVFKRLDQDVRLVFLFDEFEVLDPMDKSDLKEGAAAVTLLPFLRKILGADLHLAFVFVVGRTDDLSANVKSTFRSALERRIWVLDAEGTRALVRQAEGNRTLQFTEEGVERVRTLTNGHPYLTQLLCHRIWQQGHSLGAPYEVPVIGPEEVQAAIPGALETGGNALEYIWDGLTPPERVYAAAMGEIALEGKAVSPERVIEKVAQHAPGRRNRDVEEAHGSLVKRQVLTAAEDGSYLFEIEVFRRWIHQQKTLRKVDDELDRLRPEAERFFSLGGSVFHKKKWPQARDLFRKALEINPEHAGARRMLGETLLMLDLRKEAVEEMEVAFKLDPKKARIPFVRSLASYAEEIALEDENAALSICEKAFQINEKEELIRKVRSSIWKRWGDRYFGEGKYDTALYYYREARAVNEIKKLQSHRRQHEARVDRVFQGVFSAAEGARAASAACRQAAAAAPDLRSRGVWLGAVKMLMDEEGMVQRLADGVDRLRIAERKIAADSKEGIQKDEILVQEILSEVKRVYREDEDHWAAALNFASNDSGIGLAQHGARETQASSGSESTEALKAAGMYRDTLRNAIRDCMGREELAKTVALKFQWAEVARLLRQKENASSSYVAGIENLRNENWTLAQDYFGWVSDVPERSPAPVVEEVSFEDRTETPSSVIWQMEAIKSSEKLQLWTEAPVTSIVFPSQGNYVAAASTAAIRVSQLDGKLMLRIENAQLVHDLALSPDGTALAAAFDNGVINVWSRKGGKLLRSLKLPSSVLGVRFYADNRRLVGVTDDCAVVTWDTVSERTEFSARGGGESAQAVAIYHTCEYVATGSDDGTIKVWHVETGKLLRTIEGHEEGVKSVAFSPRGGVVASGSGDATVRLWDVAHKRLLRKAEAFEGAVSGLGFSVDGRAFASSSADGKIRIWDTNQTSLLQEFDEPAARVARPVFSPANAMLAWGTWDDIICLWREGEGIRRLGGEEVQSSKGHESSDRDMTRQNDGLRKR